MPKCKRSLEEFDIKVLSDRGVPLYSALRNKLRTELGALLIPYADLTGQYDGYALRRPHKPPFWRGKLAKYVAPPGRPSRAYFPQECRAALLDPCAPLYLTEGPLKALALASLGCAAVALQGVWNWKVSGTENLLPDLAAVPLAGRVVFVVFDHDPKPETRSNVDAARVRLAKALCAAGASEVYNVELPPGPNGAKQGVDDLLVAHGPELFKWLVSRAAPIGGINVNTQTGPGGAIQLLVPASSMIPVMRRA